MVGGVGRKEELTETLVTSQRAAECCKELRWLGRELAWLQIPFFFFFYHRHTPALPCLACLLASCTPACLHSSTLFSQLSDRCSGHRSAACTRNSDGVRCRLQLIAAD